MTPLAGILDTLRPMARTALPRVEGGFRVIVSDTPWRFKSNSAARPGRNAMRHYACMTLDEIQALPVADVAAKDAALFLWVPSPFLVIGAHIPIMRAWGFEPTASGFVWIKTNGDGSLHFGGGYTTRKNAEFVVLGKRGRSVRVPFGCRVPHGRYGSEPRQA
jgi:N6-adenosine-specific RNA methylase IME4